MDWSIWWKNKYALTIMWEIERYKNRDQVRRSDNITLLKYNLTNHLFYSISLYSTIYMNWYIIVFSNYKIFIHWKIYQFISYSIYCCYQPYHFHRASLVVLSFTILPTQRTIKNSLPAHCPAHLMHFIFMLLKKGALLKPFKFRVKKK